MGIRRSSVCNRFDASNDLVLEHMNAFLDFSPKWTLTRAVIFGHLHLVQRISLRNPRKFQCCCQEAMDSAAEFGHLEVVKWLHMNRSEGCTTDAMDMAACNGHLGIVQWLHENRTEGCTSNAIDFAAQQGHLEVVQWLHFNRKEGATHYAIDNAATQGHLNVIQWLYAHREEGCSQSAVVNAINAGHEDVAKWLAFNCKNDCACRIGFVEYLARRGYWDVADLKDNHSYLKELVDELVLTDDEDEEELVIVPQTQEREFLRRWSTDMRQQ
ncbi:unnamed protein product [Peronospora belbahrii]|uniref:Ankyrin repeat-containing domain n=1 Tax=Peronospora belbahrii TaxID=622444 RepID=A0ABN8CNI1_9STRA|nr:unnamed protein product [Peronospora belbahrii]